MIFFYFCILKRNGKKKLFVLLISIDKLLILSQLFFFFSSPLDTEALTSIFYSLWAIVGDTSQKYKLDEIINQLRSGLPPAIEAFLVPSALLRFYRDLVGPSPSPPPPTLHPLERSSIMMQIISRLSQRGISVKLLIRRSLIRG